MAKTSNVFARVEPELKEQAESVKRGKHVFNTGRYSKRYPI